MSDSDSEVLFVGYGGESKPHHLENSSRHKANLRELEEDEITILQHNPRKRRRTHGKQKQSQERDLIVISSDSDEDAPVRWPAAAGRVDSISRTEVLIIEDSSDEEKFISSNKRQKTAVSGAHFMSPEQNEGDGYESDDSDYSLAHAALVLSLRENWNSPRPSPSSNIEGSSQHAPRLETPSLNYERLPLGLHSVNPSPARGSALWTHHISEYGGNNFSWVNVGHRRYLVRKKFRSVLEAPFFDPVRYLLGIRHVQTMKRAAGPIIKIAQSGCVVVIGSATDNGVADTSDEDYSEHQYNSKGALVVHYGAKVYIPTDGHRRQSISVNDREVRNPKQYTVNDVQFDPLNQNTFFSAGNDRTVREWDITGIESGNEPRMNRFVEYDCVPHALSFQPGSSLLAVSGSDGCVYLQKAGGSRERLVVQKDHVTADMCWGRDASSDMIYALSESQEDDEMGGPLKAFDVSNGRSYKFQLPHAGQRLAIDPSGSRLAVQSNPPNSPPVMRIFDISRKNPRPSHTIELENFDDDAQSVEHSHEINRFAFSPDGDGLYIAIARSDNSCHVYDSRFLDRVLHYCRHDDSVGHEPSYGVVNPQWVKGTHRAALVTGGADGRVRLWHMDQPSDHPSDSRVLASCDFDISHFMLGDVSKGEKSLIIGEASGAVNVFDCERRIPDF